MSVEGEDLADIVDEFLQIGIKLLKSNRKEIRTILDLIADEAFEILMERKTLERGAQLYKKINSEINWTYKQDKRV